MGIRLLALREATCRITSSSNIKATSGGKLGSRSPAAGLSVMFGSNYIPWLQKLTNVRIMKENMRTGNLPANMKKARVIQIIPCKAVGMWASCPGPPTFVHHARGQAPLGDLELCPKLGRKDSPGGTLRDLHGPIGSQVVPRI